MQGTARLILLFAIGLFIILPDSFSQVVVEKSKDKVVISGKPYYIHIVKKGETSYSISRAYGISVEQLVKDNPSAAVGIKEGQSLMLPVVAGGGKSGTRVNQAPERDESKFIYHSLKTGDTVYSLARRFGVSEDEILQSNPGVEINKLPVGYEIAIPKRQFAAATHQLEVPGKDYISHKVERGESITSIASKYGVTVREIRRENRGVIFPKVDDILRVPVKSPEVAENSDMQADTALTVIPENESDTINDMARDFTPVRELEGKFHMAVFLPLYYAANSERIEIDSSQIIKGKPVYKLIKRPDQWIYPGSLPFLEMYQGILLAADTLRALGLDITIHLFDTGRDSLRLKQLIGSGDLDNMDLIIGPVYSHNLLIMADYARSREIPVVSPVPLRSNMILKDNPLLFMANPSLEVAQEAISERISSWPESNFVFIHADSGRNNPEVRAFRGMIFKELSNKISYDEISFKELLFYSRSALSNDSINRLEHTLSDRKENIILIASEEPPILSETLMDVHTLSKKYPVKVIGYPAMRDLGNLDPKYFFELGIELYSPYWIDFSNADVRNFIGSYRKKFLSEPAEMSFAWQGYDIAYYFLSGMAIHGKRFLRRPWIHNPDLLETEFDFERKEPGYGFENHKLFLVKYTGSMDVVQVNEDIAEPDRRD
jgi:LysM repeat protein